MYGYTAKASPDKNEVKYLRITDIQNDSVNWDEVPGCEIPDDKLKKYLLGKGDIVFARTGATTGKSFLVKSPPKSVFASYLIRVQVNNEFLLPEYVHYFFQTQYYWITINKGIAGAAQGGFNATKLKGLQIPIPPLPEQKAIVRLLDQAFAAIEQAQANLEKNIANAEELFQSKLNEIFSQRGEGWEEKKFSDVCVLQRGFDLPKRLRLSGLYPLVSSSGVIDTHQESKVKAPGVVTGRSGSIGKVFFIEEDYWPLNTTLYIKDFKDNLEKYVFYFLKNFDLSSYSSGAGVPTLNRNFVHNELVFSTSNIEEQKKLYEQLDSLKEKVDILKSKYGQKLEELNDLKKSLLQKAFTGELSEKSAEQLLSNAKS
jgi:type I restriction enzyme S subunit